MKLFYFPHIKKKSHIHEFNLFSSRLLAGVAWRSAFVLSPLSSNDRRRQMAADHHAMQTTRPPLPSLSSPPLNY